VCIFVVTASFWPFTILLHICTVCKTAKTLRNKNAAIIEVFFCLTVAIGLPGDASNHNKDKRSAVATRIQSKVVVVLGSCENQLRDLGCLSSSEAAVRKKSCNVLSCKKNHAKSHATIFKSHVVPTRLFAQMRLQRWFYWKWNHVQRHQWMRDRHFLLSSGCPV